MASPQRQGIKRPHPSSSLESSLSKVGIASRYVKIDKIGEGSYGVVYKARKRGSRAIVALKKVKLNQPDIIDKGIPSSSLREIAALKDLKHPNILRLYDVIYSGSSLYLVLEYLEEDLKRMTDRMPGPLPLAQAKSYLWQLLNGLSHCHLHKIAHRDLKLQNLLVDKEGRIKLADFGLARPISLPLHIFTNQVVTLWYRAPELLLGQNLYGPAVDMWSLGCIFAEMLTKRPLFPGKSEIDQLFRIFRTLGTPTEDEWPGVSSLPYFQSSFPNWPKQLLENLLSNCDIESVDLINKMLQYDPNKRISARNALQTEYFKDSDFKPPRRFALAMDNFR
ncbi:Cyclin-dependent kinase 3, partial [Fragariocoptes setiger]